jgi:hypothetical protein
MYDASRSAHMGRIGIAVLISLFLQQVIFHFGDMLWSHSVVWLFLTFSF